MISTNSDARISIHLNLFQIYKVVLTIGDYMQADVYSCVGGTRVAEMIGHLQKRPQIVVGTPGEFSIVIYVSPQVPSPIALLWRQNFWRGAYTYQHVY